MRRVSGPYRRLLAVISEKARKEKATQLIVEIRRDAFDLAERDCRGAVGGKRTPAQVAYLIGLAIDLPVEFKMLDVNGEPTATAPAMEH